MLSPAARHVSSVNPVNQLPVICDNKSFSFWVWDWLRNLQENTEILIRQECFWGLSQFLNGSCIWHYNFTPPAVHPVGCTTDNFVWERVVLVKKQRKKVCIVMCLKPDRVKTGQIRFVRDWSDYLGEKHQDGTRTVLLKFTALKIPLGLLREDESGTRARCSICKHLALWAESRVLQKNTNNLLFLHPNPSC